MPGAMRDAATVIGDGGAAMFGNCTVADWGVNTNVYEFV
jgi:hypothetical protein